MSFAQENFFSGEKKQPQSSLSSLENLPCTIERIIDGDTVDLMCVQDGKKISIPNNRLLGIDAPEKSGKGNCFSKESESILSRLFSEEKKILVTFYGIDSCIGGECRNIIRIEYNHQDINFLMIYSGLAFAWVEFENIPVMIRNIYRAGEVHAQEKGYGIWSHCRVDYSVHDGSLGRPKMSLMKGSEP